MLDFLKGKDASQVWCSFPNPQFTGKVWVALGPAEQCLAAAMWSYFIYPDHNITNEQGQSLQPGKVHSVGTQSLPFISLRLLFSLRSNNTPLFCLYLLSILPLILCSNRLTFSSRSWAISVANNLPLPFLPALRMYAPVYLAYLVTRMTLGHILNVVLGYHWHTSAM